MPRRNRTSSASRPAIPASPSAGAKPQPGDYSDRPHHDKKRSAILMLIATAIALPLLFPPFYCYFLAPFALVPFAVCIIRRPLRGTYLAAYYLLGVAFFLPNLFWMAPVTVLGWLALSLYVAIYFPLFAIGFNRLVVHLRIPATLALPLTWTALEYIRSTFPWGGFPWFNLGNCLAPSPLLIQTADLFGVWGLTFLIAMANGFIVDLLRLPLRQMQPGGGGRGRFSPFIGRLTAAVTLVTALVTGYGAYRLGEQTTHPGPRVAVIQENMPQQFKDSSISHADIFLRHLALTDQAIAQSPKPDLVAWPETMVPYPINKEAVTIRGMPDAFGTRQQLAQDLAEAAADPDQLEGELRGIDDVAAALRQESDKSGVALLVGYSADIPPLSQGEPAKLMNNTLLILPESAPPETQPTPGPPADPFAPRQEYSKVHLVPFGEFIPYDNVPFIREILLKLTPADFDYSNTAGDKWTRFTLPVTETWQEAVEIPAAATATAPATATTAPATSASSPASSAPAPIPSEEIRSETRFFTFATPICFEDAMPEPARQMTSPSVPESRGRKTDFLINVSNDGWFAAAELDQHLEACQIRALEERVPIARSVNTGNSGFIDSDGRVVKLVTDARGKSIGAVGTAAMVMQIDSRVTLFSRIGDLLPIVCGIIGALLVAWTIVRPRIGKRKMETA